MNRALPFIAGLVAAALWVGATTAQMTGGGSSGGSTGGSSGGSSGGGSSSGGGLGSGQGFGPGSLGGQQQGKSYAPTESAKTSSSTTNNGNPFNAYYANPLSMGLGGTTSGTSGGSTAAVPGYRSSGSTGTTGGTLSNALYPNIYTTTTNSNVRISGTAGGIGNAGGLGGGFGGRGGQMGGVNGLSGTGTGTRSYGYVIGNVTTSAPTITSNPQYTPVAGPDFRISLQQVLARSSSLSSAGNVQVVSDGTNTYVLRGSVASDRDRRLAENVLRLSPGVRQVRNELEIIVPPAPVP